MVGVIELACFSLRPAPGDWTARLPNVTECLTAKNTRAKTKTTATAIPNTNTKIQNIRHLSKRDVATSPRRQHPSEWLHQRACTTIPCCKPYQCHIQLILHRAVSRRRVESLLRMLLVHLGTIIHGTTPLSSARHAIIQVVRSQFLPFLLFCLARLPGFVYPIPRPCPADIRTRWHDRFYEKGTV